MKHNRELIKNITDQIYLRLQTGFKPDNDTLHFLKTSYGVNNENELLDFLNDPSLNDGTIYELTDYPDDGLRVEIEKNIPAEGLTASEIESIHENLRERPLSITIITAAGIHNADTDSSLFSISNYIKKLNLEQNLQYLGNKADSSAGELYFRSRALLRKKKFIPSGDRCIFMKRMIQYSENAAPDIDDILKLIENAVTLLSGNKEKALDDLAAKKYYFESVLSQAEEYSILLKNWGMELLLMRRIQPPPVSKEEAINSIRTIDRLTSIVYGLVIPPSDIAVQMSIDRSQSSADIFS
jgi:hypothetical protein